MKSKEEQEPLAAQNQETQLKKKRKEKGRDKIVVRD